MRIKNLIYNLNYKPFLRNYILLESNPDFSDNTKAVFDELIRLKVNEKYKLIWLVDNKKDFKDIKIKNVKFITRKKRNTIRYRLFAKYIIDCNKYIKKLNKNQFRIHLRHGTDFKDASFYNSNIGSVDVLIQLSDFFINIPSSSSFGIDKSIMIATGYPRNDWLFREDPIFKKQFKSRGQKVIVWMPTYRNHKTNTTSEKARTSIKFKCGMPTIESETQLQKLNTFLAKKNIILIFKPHPAEDISTLKSLNLSNIKIISNEDLIKNKYSTIYHLLSISDALITDYSSIYYDYLLLDKPIGLATPDYDEFMKKVGFIFDDLKPNLPGEYFETFNGLIKFLKNVADGKDNFKKERTAKKKLYHAHFDDKSTERVIKILLNQMAKDK